MTNRDRLIKILSVPIYPHVDADPTEVVADYLLDNDVVPVVRCKDCKWGTTPYGDEHDGWTECINIHGRPLFRDDGFCSYGERRDNGED